MGARAPQGPNAPYGTLYSRNRDVMRLAIGHGSYGVKGIVMHTPRSRSYTARIANDLGRIEAISRRPVPRRHPGFFFPTIPAQ